MLKQTGGKTQKNETDLIMWRKYTHCLSMGKSLRAAEFWQVTVQRPWQGQSSSKGRDKVWQGRLPSFPISDKQTKAPLAFCTIQSSTRSCYKLKAPATQTVFKTGSQFIFMKDLSIWLGAVLQTPRSARWETASCYTEKRNPLPDMPEDYLHCLELAFSPLWCTPLQELLEGKAVVPA